MPATSVLNPKIICFASLFGIASLFGCRFAPLSVPAWPFRSDLNPRSLTLPALIACARNDINMSFRLTVAALIASLARIKRLLFASTCSSGVLYHFTERIIDQIIDQIVYQIMPSEYIQNYTVILMMLGVVVVLAGAMIAHSWLLGQRRPTARKQSAYECGMTPTGDARQRFSVKFYLVAMVFILFDVEIVFLYPWAVYFGGGSAPEIFGSQAALRQFLFFEMLVFLVILFLGWYWVVKKKALDWGHE